MAVKKVEKIEKICKNCGFQFCIHTDEKVREPTKCKKCNTAYPPTETETTPA